MRALLGDRRVIRVGRDQGLDRLENRDWGLDLSLDRLGFGFGGGGDRCSGKRYDLDRLGLHLGRFRLRRLVARQDVVGRQLAVADHLALLATRGLELCSRLVDGALNPDLFLALSDSILPVRKKRGNVGSEVGEEHQST